MNSVGIDLHRKRDDVPITRPGWVGVDGGPGAWLALRGLGWEGERVVKAAREVPLEAAECSLLGLAFGLLAFEVRLRGRVVVGAGDGDDVQRVVELAVAAAVEPVLGALA
jgi:hypothetical protein